jgi:hypothetical protein
MSALGIDQVLVRDARPDQAHMEIEIALGRAFDLRRVVGVRSRIVAMPIAQHLLPTLAIELAPQHRLAECDHALRRQ